VSSIKNKLKIKIKPKLVYVIFGFLLIITAIATFLFVNQKILSDEPAGKLYFAYGSNMNTAQMQARCGNNIEIIGPAQLDNYELGFDSRGYANIRPKGDEITWGLIWNIDDACVKSLDGYEGYPSVYNRQNVRVVIDGQNVEAFVYIESAQEFGGIAQKDYLNNKIILGAVENGLPDYWILKLEQFK